MTLPDRGESSEECPAKKPRIENNTGECIVLKDVPSLLSLSDDVLLMIFSYLKPMDLLALNQCCERLKQITYDHTLWDHVDFRPADVSSDELFKYVKFLGPTTKSFACCGKPEGRDVQLTADIIQRITQTAPNIKTFIAQSYSIDGSQVELFHFPKAVEHLSLKHCLFTNLPEGRSYFYKVDQYLPNLKVLDLESCFWFAPHSLLALSKCKNLQELRFSYCWLEDFVPYASLGTRFGFTALRVLDLRWTWVSDRELSCFNKTETLNELYLDSPFGEGGDTMISDVGITSFGGGLQVLEPSDDRIVLVRMGEKLHRNSSLKTLYVCNYRTVTDTSLKHAACCLKDLTCLNITGTSCTSEGIALFQKQRPNVTLITSFGEFRCKTGNNLISLTQGVGVYDSDNNV